MQFTWLTPAYVANLVILIPVCWQMYFGRPIERVFNGAVEDSVGLRLLVASFWVAVMGASVLGLFAPRLMMPLLMIQVAYKSLWLLTFTLPQWRQHGYAAIPIGISWTFALICVTYVPLMAVHLSASRPS